MSSSSPPRSPVLPTGCQFDEQVTHGILDPVSSSICVHVGAKVTLVLSAYQTGWDVSVSGPANGYSALAASTSPTGETHATVKFPVVGNVDLVAATNDRTAPEYGWNLHVKVVP
jgi:hypothetical protein